MVIDEDSHRQVGRRREGLFTATMGCIRNSLAIFVNVAIALIGVAGIDTTGKTPLDDQPASGVLYIRSIYMLLIPALQIATAFFVFRFPIHGARLARLRERQATVFKRLDEHDERLEADGDTVVIELGSRLNMGGGQQEGDHGGVGMGGAV